MCCIEFSTILSAHPISHILLLLKGFNCKLMPFSGQLEKKVFDQALEDASKFKVTLI